MTRHRFSQKTNEQILFCLLFCFSWQTKQISSFVFWENLRRAQTAYGFIWPLVSCPFVIQGAAHWTESLFSLVCNFEGDRINWARTIFYIICNLYFGVGPLKSVLSLFFRMPTVLKFHGMESTEQCEDFQ